MEKDAYAEYLKRNRKGKPPIACVVCGIDDENIIEMHHVDGRNNSDWVEPLCLNCHKKITSEQNKLSPKTRSKDASLQNLKAFNIISIGALLKVIGERLMSLGREMTVNV